jgi:hypothetical protein
MPHSTQVFWGMLFSVDVIVTVCLVTCVDEFCKICTQWPLESSLTMANQKFSQTGCVCVCVCAGKYAFEKCFQCSAGPSATLP